MGYGISLIRLKPGRTLQQGLAAAYAKIEVRPAAERMRLTPEHHAAWDRITESLPHRYHDDLALPAITQAYRVAAIVEQETDLAGYDLQADQPVAGGDLGLAAAKLSEAILHVREFLARRGSSADDFW